MDFKIIWTDPAIEGLSGIVRGIAEDNPPAALDVGRQLVSRMEMAANFPRMGPLYSQFGLVEIRCLTQGNYRLYYRVRVETKVIEVVAVRHSAREQPQF